MQQRANLFRPGLAVRTSRRDGTICAAVEEATMRAGSGIAKAGPRRRQRAVRSRAAQERRGRRPALARGGWVGGALAGWEYFYAAVFEELFGSGSRTSPLACKGDVRGRMRELMEEMLRQAPPSHFGFGHLRRLTTSGPATRGSPGAAPACPSFQIAWRCRTRQRLSSCDPGSAVRPPMPGRVRALSTRRVHRRLTLRPANKNGGRWCAAWCGAGWRGACPQTLCHLVVPRGPSR